MNSTPRITRRGLLSWIAAGLGTMALGSCQKLSDSKWFPKILGLGEKATQGVQRLILPRKAMVREFMETDLDAHFRSNGTALPNNPAFLAMAQNGFSDYRLTVDGLVEKPSSFSLEEIHAFPNRTQITRHDCVEGWSAIGKWKGARLSSLLEKVHVKPSARYVVFYCADPMNDDGSSPYYESIDMEDAFHSQTILAYELNGTALPLANGAPIRLRVERQLGYKHAKYIVRLEIVEDFSRIAGGKGGYWEDQGYEWYAGI